MNKTEKKNTTEKTHKATVVFFWKRLIKLMLLVRHLKESERIHIITKIRNEKKEGTITDPGNIKKIVRRYLHLTLSTKFKNSLSCALLNKYNLPKPT